MEENELPDLDSFRRECATCPNGVTAIRYDIHALYQYAGLPCNTGSYLQNSVNDSLFEAIKATFQAGHHQVNEHFRSLQKELLYAHVLDGNPLGPEVAVIATLLSAMRPLSGQPKSALKGNWKLAVQRVVEYNTLFGDADKSNEDYINAFQQRDREVAFAAMRLRERGYALRREVGNIFLEPADEDRLIKRLQQVMASFPGARVSQKLFSLLSPNYDSVQERYHYGRRPSQFGAGRPQIPINFLLQLCAKHSSGKKPYRCSQRSWNELIELSTDYAALFDVQPYNSFGMLFNDVWTLLPFLRELALYDSLFSVTQIRPSDVIKLARGLLGWLQPDEKMGIGWTLNDFILISEAIISGTVGVRGSSFVTYADVERRCPTVDPKIVRFALDEVFSHSQAGANQRFNKPTDKPEDNLPREEQSGHDFFEHPLLKSRDNGFILLEKSFCAPAIIESLFKALRATKIKNFDSLVGDEIERFLLNELSARGITAFQGDYDDALGVHGECDAVIECPDTVIFIEMKKQPLTRKAQAGIDTALLIDMAASLLLAQLQAGWHEVRIRRDGSLLLEQNGQLRRSELNGRSVERIAVTLFDYGGFQDRMLLQQFLQAQLAAEYKPVDNVHKVKFEKINEHLNELRTQTAELHALLDEKGEAARFFNCWFLSVPQFLVLLDGVSSPQSLKDELWNTRHISFGTLDFYFEHAYMKGLRSQPDWPK